MGRRDEAFAALVAASERVAIMQPAARFDREADEAWAAFYIATNKAQIALADATRSDAFEPMLAIPDPLWSSISIEARVVAEAVYAVAQEVRMFRKEVTHGAPGQSRDRGEKTAGATHEQSSDRVTSNADGLDEPKRDGGERPASDAPVRSALTPALPPGRSWAVQVVSLGYGVFATVFSAGEQHFTIARSDDEGAERHCRFIAQMFEGALRAVVDASIQGAKGGDDAAAYARVAHALGMEYAADEPCPVEDVIRRIHKLLNVERAMVEVACVARDVFGGAKGSEDRG